MLHSVFINHSPETCPAAHASTRRLAIAGLAGLVDKANERGLSVVGGWADMPRHRLYLIVDAPNAHTISQVVMDLGFGNWGTVEVTPVVPMEALHERLLQLES